MQVVLSELARHTPSQIIDRLQAADVDLDRGEDASSKTESILKCIDYSHSNLSKDAQNLLLCLAPFTGGVNEQWLKQYTERLKAQPVLADLPFEHWQDILSEAGNWGLLSPHESFGEIGYLTFQPTFPFFLNTRLNNEALLDRKQAIERAFCEHLEGIAEALVQLVRSNDPQEIEMGRKSIKIEYENLSTGLKKALVCGLPCYYIVDALLCGLRDALAWESCRDLCQWILSQNENDEDQQLKLVISRVFFNVLDSLANAYRRLRDYPNADATYKRMLMTLQALEEREPTNEALAWKKLGMVAQEQRHWQEAEASYKEALQIEIEFGSRYEQASTLHDLGRLARNQHQLQEAEDNIKEALNIFIEFNSPVKQAAPLHHLGMVAGERRQWQEAEAYYKEALEIFIEFNAQHEQASTLGQLGTVFQNLRQWQEAEAYFKEALEIQIKCNARYEQAGTLRHLGMAALEQRQWVEAEAYFKEALEIYIEFNDLHGQGGILHQLGLMTQEQSQWQGAEAYYKEAPKFFIQSNARYEQAGTLHQLGQVAQEQRQWQEAIRFGLESVEIFVQFRDATHLGIALNTLSRLWGQIQDKALPEKLATIFGMAGEEAEALLERLTKN